MLADGGAATQDVVGAGTAFLLELAALVALAMYLGRSWRGTGPVDAERATRPEDDGVDHLERVDPAVRG